jgi:hypothetical protein
MKSELAVDDGRKVEPVFLSRPRLEPAVDSARDEPELAVVGVSSRGLAEEVGHVRACEGMEVGVERIGARVGGDLGERFADGVLHDHDVC